MNEVDSLAEGVQGVIMGMHCHAQLLAVTIRVI
jgi:hypothetical protein